MKKNVLGKSDYPLTRGHLVLCAKGSVITAAFTLFLYSHLACAAIVTGWVGDFGGQIPSGPYNSPGEACSVWNAYVKAVNTVPGCPGMISVEAPGAELAFLYPWASNPAGIGQWTCTMLHRSIDTRTCTVAYTSYGQAGNISPTLNDPCPSYLGSTCKQSNNSCPASPKPISFGAGNKFLNEADLTNGALQLIRRYNGIRTDATSYSLMYGSSAAKAPFGKGWFTSFLSRIRTADSPNSVIYAWASRPVGSILTFAYSSSTNAWKPDADITDKLIELKDSGGVRTGWRYWSADESQWETYDAAGVLQSIVRTDGVVQTLVYSDGTDGVASGRGGFVLDANGVPTAVVLPAGLLLRVADSFGHTLSFGYDALSHISRVTDSAGSIVQYAYDSVGNLSKVTYPDGRSKTYLYGETAYIASGSTQPSALTGILDENGVRYASYWYDANGRAYDEKVAESSLGVGRYQMTYSADSVGNITSTSVIDALGAPRTYTFSTILNVSRLTGVSQPGGSGCGAANSAIVYDTANGNVLSRSDFNGNQQCFKYDTGGRNLETYRIEGLSTSTACASDLSTYTPPTPVAGNSVTVTKTSTNWHPDWRLETRRAEPKKISTWVYNGQPDPTTGESSVSCAPASALVIDKPIAVLCRQIEQATSDETGGAGFSATAVGSARITRYTYNQYGQLLSEDGPRTDISDVTTYSYYSDTSFDASGYGHTQGDLYQVTNALNQTTTYSLYDKAGRVRQQQDANGLITRNSWSARGWLTQQDQIAGAQTLSTLYSYDNAGQLKTVTQADGSAITYTYDDAHRLTDIADKLGNTIHYTLDPAGNRTKEETKDSGGTLRRTVERIYDQLGRLQNVKVQ